MARKFKPLAGSEEDRILTEMLKKQEVKNIRGLSWKLRLSPMQLSLCLLGFMTITEEIGRKLSKVLSQRQLKLLKKRNRLLINISNVSVVDTMTLDLINTIVKENNLVNVSILAIAECMEGRKTTGEIRNILCSSQK